MIKLRVPFFDLTPQFISIDREIRSALDEVFKSQQFILGPQVKALEQTIAGYCETSHAVGVASGSDALFLSLMALGIETGDEVLLPSFTFFATAGAVSRLGAIPVFVDIDPHTYNIDPLKIEAKITSRTKAVIPVHLFGQCADMDAILRIAESRRLFVIEDAAQALGAEYKPPDSVKGQKAGQMEISDAFPSFPLRISVPSEMLGWWLPGTQPWLRKHDFSGSTEAILNISIN